jgi:hypothetical protein
MNPPESFVPLTAAPAAAAPREFRVAILNGHDHSLAGNNGHAGGLAKAGGFQSLESQRPSPGNPGGEMKLGEPRVTLERDGDRVTHLRIQCTCGMIMDLACVYDPPPPKA